MQTALRITVSLGLLAWLLLRTDLGQVFASMGEVPAGSIAAVTAIVLLEVGIASLRWWLFVPNQSLLQIARLTLIGSFYGIVLPGQVGGEAVKAYRLGAGRPDAEQIAASVFVDKLNGLIGLLVLGNLGAVLSHLDFARPLWMTFSIALALGLVGIYAIRVPVLRSGFESANRSAVERWPVWAALCRRFALFFAAWTHYSSQPLLMLASIGLGMVFQLLAISAILIFASAFGIAIPFVEWLWTFAIISLATLLPLSVGGLGVREGAFVAILGLQGVSSSSALALSLTIFASQLATAFVGGLLEIGSLRARRREHR